MFKFFPELQKTEEERELHISALDTLFENEKHHRLFEHLYSTLTILDAKSSSLLVFNGILIAVFAVFMPTAWPLLDRILVIAGVVFILASCVLLLAVVWVRWTTTPHLKLGKAHYSNRLLELRNSRTRKYAWAWYCSVVAMLCLCIIFGIKQYRGERNRLEPSEPQPAQSR